MGRVLVPGSVLVPGRVLGLCARARPSPGKHWSLGSAFRRIRLPWDPHRTRVRSLGSIPRLIRLPWDPRGRRYSHSMVPGGLLVISSTTRVTSATSPVMRFAIFDSSPSSSRAQSAVMASSLVTGRSTTGIP